MIEAEQLHARILARLDMTRDMEDEELTELIYEVLQEVSQEEYLPLDQKTMLGKELFNAFRKLDLLQEFLEDDKITEIMINGTENIFLEKEGKLIRSGKRLLSRPQRLFIMCQGNSANRNVPKYTRRLSPPRMFFRKK